MLTPQEIENVILALSGLFALGYLRQLVKHVHVISVALRLRQNDVPSATKMPIANKELEAIIDKTEAGRYARFSFPDSLRPFKE